MRPVFFLTLLALEAACWRNITPTASGTPSPIQMDTTVIVAYNTPSILDNTKELVMISLTLPAGFQFDEHKTYLLKIDSVIPHVLPEGVYEMYLGSGKQNGPNNWNSSSEDFLDLLNLYGLSADSPSSLVLDISDNLRKKFKTLATPISKLKFVVAFQGNQMPDGSLIHHEGKLELKNLSLLETK